MKVTLKYLTLLFFLLIGAAPLFAQKKTQTKKDTVYIEKNTVPVLPETEYQNQIKELNKEIADLSKTVADTKQSFYDSKLNFWNYLVTVIALLFVIVAYVGLKSISEKISDLKLENEKAISKSETSIKEIKDDLIQRISEIKADVREFKENQSKLHEKFEKDANDKIKQGLDTELSKAIDKVMKGSFENVLNEITEQLNDLTKQVDSLPKSTEPKQATLTDESTPAAPLSIVPKTNAFDDEQS